MKFLVLMALATQNVLCFAGSGVPCQRVEYAQLKDSDKKELTDTYCDAMRTSKLNEDLRAIQKGLFDKQLASGADSTRTEAAMRELGEAQVSCVRVADAAASMLAKKYKSKPARCD